MTLSSTQKALNDTLLIAIEGLNTNLAALVIRKGADRELLAAKANEMLERATSKYNTNNPAIIFLLENGADTAVLLSKYHENISTEVLEVALQKGLNSTALLFAAVKAKHLEGVKIAVEKGGADVKACNKGQPLVFAVTEIHDNEKRRGTPYEVIFSYLESCGMDINAREADTQNTLIHHIVKKIEGQTDNPNNRNDGFRTVYRRDETASQQTLVSYQALLYSILSNQKIDPGLENNQGVSGLAAISTMKNISSKEQHLSIIERALWRMPDCQDILPSPLGVDELNRIKAQGKAPGA